MARGGGNSGGSRRGKGGNERADQARRFGLRRAMISDWGEQRVRRLKRLGEWMAREREASGQSLAVVADEARAQEEPMTNALIWRLEKLRDLLPEEDTPRRGVDFSTVWFLARYYGQTLADLEHYLLTGDESLLEPSEQARLNAVRSAYLLLTPERREIVEEFMQFQLDLQRHEQAEPPRHTSTPLAAALAEVDAAEAARTGAVEDAGPKRANGA